jgi:alanyl-tRNA synthetase
MISKINGARLLYCRIDNIDPKVIRLVAEELVKKHADLVVVYVSKSEAKLAILVATSKAISEQYHAGNIAKEIATEIGGSGGGQATLAQAGVNDIGKLAGLESVIKKILS